MPPPLDSAVTSMNRASVLKSSPYASTLPQFHTCVIEVMMGSTRSVLSMSSAPLVVFTL